ncbi:hypothetical protein ASZ90_015463 [hydrocarbon metagenome]|uniref:Uncharacterized protein n=1 Tax=hydrocarbon metagenome TaxID=938273 RepID=A0A0W8F1S8_9ZZZZ
MRAGFTWNLNEDSILLIFMQNILHHVPDLMTGYHTPLFSRDQGRIRICCLVGGPEFHKGGKK